MKSIGVGMPAELIDAIDKQRAREGVRTGTTPSRSEWLRRLARRELDDESAPGAESVEA